MNLLLTIKKKKKFLILLFLISFFLRAIIFNFFLNKENRYWNYDSAAYNDVAVKLCNGDGFINNDGTTHFYRLPGYALFLTASYKVFGINEFEKTLWIQLFLASFIPLLIFLLSLVLFSQNFLLAKIVSIISSFHLGYVLFSGLLMTESLFVLLFILFLIFFFPQVQLFFCKKTFEKSFTAIFLSGIFLGAASLFRPVGHYLIFLSILLLIFSNQNLNDKVKNIFLIFCGWFLIIGGWILRNYFLTGCLFLHTLSGPHFLKHSAARLAMYSYDCSYEKALNLLKEELCVLQREKENKLGRNLNQIEFCNLQEELTLQYFKKNLKLSFLHCFSNMFKTCFSLHSSELMFIDSGGKLPEYDKNRGWKDILKRFLFPDVSHKFLIFIIYLDILFLLLLWLGVFGFFFNLIFLKKSYLEFLCLFFKYFSFVGLFIFISLACGFARLRLPVEPILIILSSKFWLDLFYREKRVL